MRIFTLKQIVVVKYMIRSFFSSIANTSKSLFTGILQFPTFIKGQINRFKKELNSLRHHLNNMTVSNLNLGIYHMYNRNYNDAIFRFKMVDKLLDPGNKEANYWLGWVYFLKTNYKKSIMHLTKAKESDRLNLLEFVKSIDSAKSIPFKIHEIHRDITAELFVHKFANDKLNLPKQLVIELSKAIKFLPEEYRVLELGCNLGLLGYELNKRMQESYVITSVEISNSMIKLQPTCFPEQEIYDQVLHIPVDEFLKQNTSRYDVICSMHGFAFEADLQNIFDNIFSCLLPKGYFAFAVKSSEENKLSKKDLEFSYNQQQISKQLTKSGFTILFCKEFSLEIKNNYSIFVCTK